VENHLKSCFETINQYAIISKTDIDGVIKYVNDNFCRISGYTLDEIIGKRHSLLRHSDTKYELYTDMWNTILDGRVWKGRLKNRSKLGPHYYLDNTIHPVIEDGVVSGFLSVAYNITEIEDAREHNIKTLFNSILQNRDTIVDRAMELEVSLDELKKILDDKYKTLLNPSKDFGNLEKIKEQNVKLYENIKELSIYLSFDTMLDSEVAKAHRYSYSLSIVRIAINIDRISNIVNSIELVKIAQEFKKCIDKNTRISDVVSKKGSGDIYVILSNSNHESASVYAKKIEKAVTEEFNNMYSYLNIKPIIVYTTLSDYESAKECKERVDTLFDENKKMVLHRA